MTKLFLSIFISIMPIFLYCQDTTKSGDLLLISVEKNAEFFGGNEALQKYVNTNAIYTKQAIKDSIEGIVVVNFLVTKEGTISNSKVVRGIHHDLDSISLDIMNKMPKWLPAIYKGQPVEMKYTFPIIFKLHEKKEDNKPIPMRYWLEKGEKQFKEICIKQYVKSKTECDCWYNFIIWNYNSLKLEDLDLKIMFERQKCDN